MKRTYLSLSLATLPFLAGCGGGGDGTTLSESANVTLSGTVPGTRIEVFCEDGTYRRTSSVDNGTSQHPFSIDIPADIACQTVMTVNENDATNRIVVPIAFTKNGTTANSIKALTDTDLGYIDLPTSPNGIDSDGNHLADTPLHVSLDDSDAYLATATRWDLDGDGIVDPYEDDDGDGTLNAYEDDDNDGVPNVEDDENGNGIPDYLDDDDDDGVPNYSDTSNGYVLLAWNDLGMHCMDDDYSVFSILPPYNTLHAQLKDKNGNLVTSGISITFVSTTGTDGKINTYSDTKSNFWQYSEKLFNVILPPNTGLKGVRTPSGEPQELTYASAYGWWEAEGIPITPYNDDGSKNYYPMVKVTAKDLQGNILASVETVLPVSDEMDCKRCHASNTNDDAKPASGWVNMDDAIKDYKYNILRLHDDKHPSAVADHIDLLREAGYDYNTSGLEATALGGTPILCAACHKTNAMPGIGIGSRPEVTVPAFTAAMHGKHATVKDPDNNGMLLGDINNRTACYACHPGADTKCLRGAMGDATDSEGNYVMQCQSCHGTMHNVGDPAREGWLDEPNCQACHYTDANGNPVRETSAVLADGTLRAVVESRFATMPDTPFKGISLYRYSKGHGNLQCEACHGSTHAIYPAHTADNILSQSVQGHSGTIGECTACHTTVPDTVTGGPHGMHPVGEAWIDKHEDAAEKDATQCKACHGQDYRGTFLSKTWTARTFNTEYGTKNYNKGDTVTCYDCHNGPSGEDD